ncbi:hypothetical protein GCM10011351_09790 [Paraliobacillus quinghaiensis]|uniref:Alpha/beta hydrolase n=1 Tax=Paraliobacillus quinghaiensis TaxID=470815 RepID=A0A917TJU8_9BACI|nr:hypothetical protein [Paraliobacillus quinghaiensis]GGM26195.1 hypothetical protein GCM10011351_09790 [Paraliobacillus quinghaiensis]
MRNFFVKVGQWLCRRLVRTPERDRIIATWFIIGLFMATTIASIIEALGNPTGVGFVSRYMDIWKAVSINGLYFLLWTVIIGVFLSLIYLPLPRLFLGSISYAIYSSIVMLLNENSGEVFSYIVGVSYSIVSLLVVLILLLICHKRMRKVVILFLLPTVLISTTIYLVFYTIENKNQSVKSQPAFADVTDMILDENPAEKGDYPYTFLTYGNGNDKYRKEFGESVDITTKAVDASSFITKWGEKRQEFWGFDQSELPVNGRVWLPKGDGPFPVILIVHGNHTMEDFSTSGYDYLGELLASRGFLTISVDEDFINYSNTSGSPNRNYELRVWTILEHFIQLQEMNQNTETALFNKIDFERVGLIGHSRGGQAVQMVADYERFFDDNRFVDSMENIQIKGVVSLAPTDKIIKGKRPRLDNISYLLLQGARDGDVNNLRGERQFYRTNFDKESDGFKASLYIEDANHSQFNTNWGRMDNSLPRGLFLNQAQIMEPESQRQIAKVYISAFFERVFHNKTSYEKLFRDYQYGKHWLPDTTLVSKYQNSTYTPIIEHQDDKAVFENGVIATADGFNVWKWITPEDRRGNNRPVDATLLEWEDHATYSISLPDNYLSNLDSENIRYIYIRMANLQTEEDIPDIQVELAADGIFVEHSLDDFIPFPPVILTKYTHFGLMDRYFRDGKYENAWEPIFQTFAIPIEAFEEVNQEFEKEDINNITLHFTSHSGKVLLEVIGVGS